MVNIISVILYTESCKFLSGLLNNMTIDV